MAVDMAIVVSGVSTDSGKVVENLFHPFAAEVATSNGDWVTALGWQSLIADVTIATTATVDLRGSNAATEPANSAHGFELKTALTATGIFELEAFEMPRYVKIRISSWASGNVDVDMKVRALVMDILG